MFGPNLFLVGGLKKHRRKTEDQELTKDLLEGISFQTRGYTCYCVCVCENGSKRGKDLKLEIVGACVIIWKIF